MRTDTRAFTAAVAFGNASTPLLNLEMDGYNNKLQPNAEKNGYQAPRNPDLEGIDSPASTSNLPAKRRRLSREQDLDANGNDHEDATYEDAMEMDDYDVSSEISPVIPHKWQLTIEKVIRAIVSIRFSQVAAFDTEGPFNTWDACHLLQFFFFFECSFSL